MSSIQFDWLPLGSVLKLKDVDIPVMIISRCQSEISKKEKVWEYAGCVYPFGVNEPDQVLLFDGDSISTVLFIGYRTEAEILYCKQLEDALKAIDEPSNHIE